MMETLFNVSSTISKEPTVLTIGAFDGIHRGHQELIRSVVTAARAKRQRAALVTFFPPPAVVLGRADAFYITSNEEKLTLLESLGLDVVVILEFTPQVARLCAGEFVDRLMERLDLRELWIGYDFALGARRQGDATFLRALGAERGFGFHSIPPVLLDGQPISSTRVRAALRQGNVQEANGCLGRPFRLTGHIVERQHERRGGDGVEGTIAISAEHALPAAGSYACHAQSGDNGRTYSAVAEIGPQGDTVGDQRTIRVHLCECAELSGNVLTLDFLYGAGEKQALAFQFSETRSLVEEV